MGDRKSEDPFECVSYLKGGSEVDWSRVRVTSLKGNRRYKNPGPVNEDDFEARWRSVEIKCQYAALEAKRALEIKYPGSKLYNVADGIERGITSLSERSNGELVVFQTDKSGRLSVDSGPNFRDKMQPHIDCGSEVDFEFVEDTEGDLNARAVSWARIIGLGTRWHQEDRVKQAMISTSSSAPFLYGVPKDHKVSDDPNEEPPLRPVCGANCGPGMRLSNLLSEVINPMVEEFCDAHWCDSTEDLEARLIEINELPERDREDLVVFSMDAKALFPSIQIERSSTAVAQLISESQLKLSNVNALELSRYLPYLLDQRQIENHGLKDLVMTRKTNLGRKPVVTGDELEFGWAERVSAGKKTIWNKAKREPSQQEVKKMLSIAVQCDVTNVMKKHLFSFDGKQYVQKEGGSIGSELTCTVAKCRMILWMRAMNNKCANLGLNIIMSCVYVDDATFVTRGLRRDDSNEYRNMELDVETAEVYKEVANSLEDDISMTFEAPSISESGKLPILDLHVWVDSEKNIILWNFYEKPMCSDLVMMKTSAFSWSMKRTVLSGEVFRRLYNTHPSLVGGSLTDDEIAKFCYKMMKSGYSEHEREIIVREGKSRYKNLVRISSEGKRPLYRRSSFQKFERAEVKFKKERSWYGKEKDGMVSVQATPGEMLSSRVSEIMKSEGFNVKVIQRGGTNVKQMLQKSDVRTQKNCLDPNCVVCLTGGKNCSKESVGYRIRCTVCHDVYVYIGETGKTARVRCGEHLADLKNRKKALWKHCVEMHNSTEVEFKYEVCGIFRDPLLRQLDEAQRIESEPGNLLNSKEEWVRPLGFRNTVENL